jgi:hypothetical protein
MWKNFAEATYLCMARGDDNVHFQNSMAMVDALVSANKQFDFMAYPDLDHAIQNEHSRLHLFHQNDQLLEEQSLIKCMRFVAALLRFNY